MALNAKTVKLSGNADYAKVAERLKLFRQDNPRSKQESAYEVDVDGTIVFTAWLWKDKSELIELMKAGVNDKDILRTSADANGTAKSNVAIARGNNRVSKEKEFEKVESIALGRALANLGYLASGEIASSEEMEEFEKYKVTQTAEKVEKAVKELMATKTLDALKAKFLSLGPLMAEPEIIATKDKRKKELSNVTNSKS